MLSTVFALKRVWLKTASALGLATSVACILLAGCTSVPEPQSVESDHSGGRVDTDHLSEISVGTEDQIVDVPVDSSITSWLNANTGTGEVPTPKSEAWHSFEMPFTEDVVVFDTGMNTNFDVLEILSYPDGLDDTGNPVNTEIHPLCGPEADVSCEDALWGTSGVKIPTDTVESSIAGTEYYAIGGVLLPVGDSLQPKSFMALVKQHGAAG